MDCGTEPAPAETSERCISREPTSGRLVMLCRGHKGFQYIAGERMPEAYNRALGLSYEQVEAMEYGALFGFDEELADPDRVRQVREELGLPVGPIGARRAAAAQPSRAPADGHSGLAGRHRQLRTLVRGGAGAGAQEALRLQLGGLPLNEKSEKSRLEGSYTAPQAALPPSRTTMA